jgi:tetratricopeptide (TPR) repeat protein
VLAFARNQERAGPNVPGLLRYYEACPKLLVGSHIDALIDLASTAATRTDDRAAILDILGRHPDEVDDDDRKRIRRISGAPAQELHEAALVCLSILGDRSARRELLDPYDDRLEKNKNWAKSYESRAYILYRIGDYREAIRDYKRALELMAVDQRTRQEEAHIGLARCYALSGKLREAAQTLVDAPMTAAEVAALGDDPDFAELRASSRYGDIFNVDARR